MKLPKKGKAKIISYSVLLCSVLWLSSFVLTNEFCQQDDRFENDDLGALWKIKDGEVIIGENTYPIPEEREAISYYDIIDTKFGYVIVRITHMITVNNTTMAAGWVSTIISQKNRDKFPERYFEKEEQAIFIAELFYSSNGRWSGIYAPGLWQMIQEIEDRKAKKVIG